MGFSDERLQALLFCKPGPGSLILGESGTHTAGTFMICEVCTDQLCRLHLPGTRAAATHPSLVFLQGTKAQHIQTAVPGGKDSCAGHPESCSE